MAARIKMFLKVGGSPMKRKDGPNDKEVDFVECASCTSGVEIPFVMKQGEGPTATDKRDHHMVVITKSIDSTTPALLQALCENMPVDEGRFEFYSQGKTGGSEVKFFVITIKDGRIVNVSLGDPETVSFVYSSIEWRWEQGGKAYEDSTKEKQK